MTRKNVEAIATMIRTIKVEIPVSLRLGHATLPIS